VLALGGLLAFSTTASADWLIIPHLGAVFGGSTTIVDQDQGAGSNKLTLGGSFAWLSDGIIGIEADVGHTPHFFETSSDDALVLDSTVTTVTGSVLATLPLSVTRESLRPYLVGGVGLMHASSDDAFRYFLLRQQPPRDEPGRRGHRFHHALHRRRFDLRQFRNLAPMGQQRRPQEVHGCVLARIRWSSHPILMAITLQESMLWLARASIPHRVTAVVIAAIAATTLSLPAQTRVVPPPNKYKPPTM
jgi:hypothetical protein